MQLLQFLRFAGIFMVTEMINPAKASKNMFNWLFSVIEKFLLG